MQLALQELIKNKTVLIIAHRLMTIRNANKIMVINHGKIEETGTHDQLLANERTYHKMWAAYTASSDWELKKEQIRRWQRHEKDKSYLSGDGGKSKETEKAGDLDGCYQYKSVFFYVPGTVCYHDIFLLCRGCRFAGY